MSVKFRMIVEFESPDEEAAREVVNDYIAETDGQMAITLQKMVEAPWEDVDNKPASPARTGRRH